jgi:hypothetical protein
VDYDGMNGFAIGYVSEHSNWERQDHVDTQSFHEVMENKVIPLFYEWGMDDIPHGWIAMQKRSLRTLAYRYPSLTIHMISGRFQPPSVEQSIKIPCYLKEHGPKNYDTRQTITPR